MEPPAQPGMSSRTPLYPKTHVLRVLRQAKKPLTGEQILERLPEELHAEWRNPRQSLANALQQPEIAKVARGCYVYLPDRLDGAVFRLPLTGKETNDAHLRVGFELAQALWFRRTMYGWLEPDVTAACELPDGGRSEMTTRRSLPGPPRMLSAPLVAAGEELLEWLRGAKPHPGDSLLVRITDPEAPVCQVALERLSERDAGSVAERNRQLADEAAAVLHDEARQPLYFYDLAAWLLARGLYSGPCPPDPVHPVLFLADERFALSDENKVMLATKWDRRGRVLPGTSPDFLDEVAKRLSNLAREYDRLGYPGLWLTEPLTDLNPWLEAAGYPAEIQAPADAEAAPEDAEAAWAQQVYCLRVTGEWSRSATGIVEARGDQTLFELDAVLRRAFRHDPTEHLSGFYLPRGNRQRPEDLGDINPFGGGEAEEIRLGEIGLDPGDTLLYVYDFGDWIEHTIRVEAITPPSPRANYPRVVASKPKAKRK